MDVRLLSCTLKTVACATRVSADRRKLYREGRLTVEELNGRLRAVKALAAGRLRPQVEQKDLKEEKEVNAAKEKKARG